MTTYALLQLGTASPTVDQLKRAFKSLPRMTEADAVKVAREAYGILLWLNRGAFGLHDGSAAPLTYASKAAFFDESLWLLWRQARGEPAPGSPG